MNKIALLMLLALIAVPAAMAADVKCGDATYSIDVNEGDYVQLQANPGDSTKYTYAWTADDDVAARLASGETALRTIDFYAPPVTACTIYDLDVLVTTKLLTAPGDCYSNDCIRVRVCPRDCPSYADTQYCYTDWASSTYAVAGTYPSGTVFAWTMTDGTTTLTSSAQSATFTKTQLDAATPSGAPTETTPERTYTLSVIVTSADGQNLLTCPAVSHIKLVYKPVVSITTLKP